METIERSAWFEAVKAVDPWFSRKDNKTLVLTFSGYKCENYRLAEEALMKFGAFFLSVDFDSHSGKTFCLVREPKRLAKPE